MKKLFNFRLLVLIGVLIMNVSLMWAATWMEEPSIVINGETKSASSLTDDDWGTQTDLKVTWVHWYGKRNDKNNDGMWGEGKFTYGISGNTGTASTWNDITVTGSDWYDDYKTVYINTDIDFQLCNNRLPGDYELYFYFQHRTGESSYIAYSNYSNNYHVKWTIPEPTIEFSSDHTPVKGQPVTLSTDVSAWAYGMTIKSVTYKHNGTAISTQTTGDLSSTSYTHTPTVAGSNKYTVEVVCTYGTAGDETYTREMDITDSYTVTYGSHTNGSFTIKVPNKDAASSNQPAASGQRVDISASGNTGYEFSSWNIYKTGTPATKITPNASTATTYFTMPAYAVTVEATFVGKHYDVTLDPDNGNSTSAIYPQYTAAMPSTLKSGGALSAPTYSGYDFQGYFDDHAGAGSQYYTSAMASANNWDKTSEASLYAKWTQSITLNQNEATKDGSTSLAATYKGVLSTAGLTNPQKIGKKFAGWTTGSGGTGSVVIEANGTVNTVANWTDGNKKWIHAGASTLYAKWDDDTKTFTGSASTDWADDDNWSGGVAPSDDWSAVTINGTVTLSSSVHIGSLTIGTGKLTIASTGVLEVAGTVTNSNSDKLEIRTTSSSQGGLIYDISSSSPAATVNMTLNGDNFQLIASPTGGASVSSQFAGEGVYTFAWIEGKGWERRGYYDSFIGEAILVKGASGATFSGTLSNICGGGIAYSATPTTASAQGVNMLMNPLTAPIKIASMTISGSEDGSVHLWNGSSWVGKAPGSAGDAVIPAMQGYGVIASSGGGTVSFDYDVAVRGASSKNAPLNAPKRTNSDILDHITVSVLTNGRKVDLELYENEQFTTGIDKGWEAIYMEGDGRFGEMYAVADKKMNILATPSLEGTVLGFAPGEAESYTISFEGDGKGYYLNDIKIGKSILIDEDNIYEFAADESTNDKRFVISKMPMQPTGVDEVADGSKARKQLIDGALYIIRDGRIYTATGAAVK